MTLEDNLKKCDQLDPLVRDAVKNAVTEAFNKKMTFNISETRRTYERQCLLLSQGRTRSDVMANAFKGGFRLNAKQMADMMKIYDEGRNLQGNTVTWTLDSDHIKGLAMDIYPINTNYADLASHFFKWNIRQTIKGDSAHFNVAMARLPNKPEETPFERLARLKQQSDLANEPMKGWLFQIYNRLKKRLRV